MMLWMYLVDPKDHILKVSCHYLYFWLTYSGFLIKLLSCGRERDETRERETSDFSSCLAKCYGWAKGYGWARAAQFVSNLFWCRGRIISERQGPRDNPRSLVFKKAFLLTIVISLC